MPACTEAAIPSHQGDKFACTGCTGCSFLLFTALFTAHEDRQRRRQRDKLRQIERDTQKQAQPDLILILITHSNDSDS